MYPSLSKERLRQDIGKYLDGSCSQEEAAALLEYLSTDPEAEMLFKEMSALRAVSDAPYFAREERESLRKLHRRIRRCLVRPFSFWVAAACAAAVVLLLVNNLLLSKKTKEIEKTYTQVTTPYTIQVPEGSRTTISLPDGSLVTLNSGSSLTYNHDFGIFDRKVELKGEGYFVVAKMPEKPFTLTVEEMSLFVTGTTFNVNAYDDEEFILVSLIEGRVNLTNRHRQTMTLYPNEEARYSRRTGALSKKKAEVKNSLDWTDGGFTFENAPFTTIAHRLERKFNIRIIIDSERLKNQYYTATFSSEKSVYDILREIDVENQYVWRETDGGLIITEKKPNP